MPDSTRKVRNFYRLGQQILAEAPADDEGYHPGVINKYVRSGLSKPQLYKARQFAQLFTPQDLERLCASKLPDGRRLGIGHIYELLQVADAQQRRELERRAAEEGWSSGRLRTARLLAVGPGGAGRKAGRKPQLPSSPAALIQQIRERTEQWLRWSATVLDATHVEDSNQASTRPSKSTRDLQQPLRFRRLPPPVRVQLQSARKSMEQLQSALDRYTPARKRPVSQVDPT